MCISFVRSESIERTGRGEAYNVCDLGIKAGYGLGGRKSSGHKTLAGLACKILIFAQAWRLGLIGELIWTHGEDLLDSPD